jgi:signal transduction histidine kinase/ligand-binding sensor domain-containing protein
MKNGPVLLTCLGLAMPAYALEPGDAPVQYTVTSWTDQAGLPSNQIRAMAQDRNGYLWLGTGAGLVRFDGVTFIPWQMKSTPELQEAQVTALCAARDGSLWVGIYDGRVSRLRDGQVVNFSLEDGLPRGRLKLLEDHEGTIWTGGRGGISRFRNNHWERVRIGNSPVETVMALYEDRSGNLWVGTPSAIFRRMAGTDAFEQLEFSNPARGFSEDGTGGIWVTDPTRGLRRLGGAEKSGGRLRALEGENGVALIHDANGTAWVATQGNGLLHVGDRMTPTGLDVERFQVSNGLANDVVVSLVEDREGNIWVGTQGGLSRLSRRLIASLSGLGVTGNVVRSIVAARDGSVWAATSGGLSRFSHGPRQLYGEREGLPSADVTALHEDANGVLWVGTDRGVARFVNGRFSPVPLPQNLRGGPIVTLTTDREGVLWFFQLDHGLFRWKGGKLSEANQAVGGKLVRSAFTDTKGRVWLGFQDGGVGVFQDGQLRLYSEREGLAGGRVDAIFEDRAGVVWVGTLGGLSRFSDDRFATLSGSNLREKTVSAIVDDESGRLWLRVSSGIVRLDPREFEKAVADPSYRIQSQFYDGSDGLGGPPVFLLPQAAARASDGTVWVVTATGVSVIDPRRLPEHRPPPAVRIEEIAADQRSFSPQPGLRVPAVTSRLQIDYAALTLSPSRTRFRYTLEGFDTDWVDAGTGRQALYTNLPPGQYRFRVASGNVDGIWNESAATWEFSLAPAFYQTNWFYGICAIAAVLIVRGAWQWRADRDRAKLAQIRSDFVASVTHELKTPIAAIRAAGETVISGRVQSVAAQRDYAQLIVKEAKRLTRSVDNLLAFSRITDVGSVYYREPLTLDTLINESLEKFRLQLADGDFSVTQDMPQVVPVVVADRRAISLVLDNLVDNAIRYSGKRRQLDIRVRPTEKQVRVEVSDRGHGIPEDEIPHVTRKFYRGRNAGSGGSGLGLAIAKRVITEHGGTFTVCSEVGVGTTVSVVLPANGISA